jgi:hypothetical protein
MQPRLKLLLLLLSTFSLQACLVESENQDSKSSQKNLSSSSGPNNSSSSVAQCTAMMSIPTSYTPNSPVDSSYSQDQKLAESLGGSPTKDGPSCYDHKRWLPNGSYYSKFSATVTFCENGKWLGTGLRTPNTCSAMGTEYPTGTRYTAWNGEVLLCEKSEWIRTQDKAIVLGPSTPPTGVKWGQAFKLQGQTGQCRMFRDLSIHCHQPATQPKYDSSMYWSNSLGLSSQEHDILTAYWADTNAFWFVGQRRFPCAETNKLGPIQDESSTWLPISTAQQDSMRVWLQEMYQLRNNSPATCPMPIEASHGLKTLRPQNLGMSLPITSPITIPQIRFHAWGKDYLIPQCLQEQLQGNQDSKRLGTLLQKSSNLASGMQQRWSDIHGPSY